MRKHEEEKHNGEHVEFKVKILGSCPGDPLLRQCMEAVIIKEENPSMNGRAEWGTGKGKPRRRQTTSNEINNNNNIITNNNTQMGPAETPSGTPEESNTGGTGMEQARGARRGRRTSNRGRMTSNRDLTETI